MRRAFALLLAVVVLPLVLACGEGERSRIAFHSTRDGGLNVYAMNADGSGVKRLTNNSALGSHPSWSPDGRLIAFVSPHDDPTNPQDERHFGLNISVMNADGLAQTRLTDNWARDIDPSWSPDGKRIAFASDRDGNWQIYVMNVDGTGPIRLSDDPAVEEYAHGSLDGRRDTGVPRLTDGPAGNDNPSWSPDGRRIVFVSYRDEGSEVYVMNADGSDQTRLTDNSAREMRPVWSPDGRRIAFNSDRDGNWEVYVMNADGSDQTRLTDNPAWDISPIWSPNGQRIAFSSDRDDPDPNDNNRIGNIYVMNADGSRIRRLTDSSASDYASSWLGN